MKEKEIITIRQNRKGLYVVLPEFGLVDRKSLLTHQPTPGEEWIAYKIKEIKDRRGCKIPVYALVERHVSTRVEFDFNKKVFVEKKYCGSVLLTEQTHKPHLCYDIEIMSAGVVFYPYWKWGEYESPTSFREKVYLPFENYTLQNLLKECEKYCTLSEEERAQIGKKYKQWQKEREIEGKEKQKRLSLISSGKPFPDKETFFKNIIKYAIKVHDFSPDLLDPRVPMWGLFENVFDVQGVRWKFNIKEVDEDYIDIEEVLVSPDNKISSEEEILFFKGLSTWTANCLAAQEKGKQFPKLPPSLKEVIFVGISLDGLPETQILYQNVLPYFTESEGYLTGKDSKQLVGEKGIEEWKKQQEEKFSSYKEEDFDLQPIVIETEFFKLTLSKKLVKDIFVRHDYDEGNGSYWYREEWVAQVGIKVDATLEVSPSVHKWVAEGIKREIEELEVCKKWNHSEIKNKKEVENEENQTTTARYYFS